MAEEITKVAFGEEFDTEQKYELIDDGEYEFEITKVEPKETIKNGKTTKRLSLTFRVRSDVDQNFKSRCVFYTIFGQEGDEYYNYRIINKIIMTQLKKGEKVYFDSVDEVLQYLNKIHLIAKVSSEYDDFRDEDKNVIVEDSFRASEWDKQDHTVTNNTEALDNIAGSDDLPF